MKKDVSKNYGTTASANSLTYKVVKLVSNHPDISDLAYVPDWQNLTGYVNGISFKLGVGDIGDIIESLPEDDLYELLHSIAEKVKPLIGNGYALNSFTVDCEINGVAFTFIGYVRNVLDEDTEKTMVIDWTF